MILTRDSKQRQNKSDYADVMSQNCDVIVTFLIFGPIGKPDSGRIFCKTYVFINSNVLS